MPLASDADRPSCVMISRYPGFGRARRFRSGVFSNFAAKHEEVRALTQDGDTYTVPPLGLDARRHVSLMAEIRRIRVGYA